MKFTIFLQDSYIEDLIKNIKLKVPNAIKKINMSHNIQFKYIVINKIE